ncbi:MAG: hypothetical protein JST20_10205 [Bacteroidetes bacterium]|nr:hypothetical protein [Bacteroidota bacterium]
MDNSTDNEGQDNSLGINSIPTRKYGYLIIYGCLALIGILSIVLSSMYRQMPKKTEVLTKRTTPAIASTYTLMLSPLDSITSDTIGESIRAHIGADSIITKMVVGGTALYKQCSSGAEYGKLISQGLREAQQANLEKQALMFSQFIGIMITDTLPARLYLAGQLGGNSITQVDKRLSSTCRDLKLRSDALGTVRVVSFLRPKDNSINSQFLQYFRDRGFDVEVH